MKEKLKYVVAEGKHNGFNEAGERQLYVAGDEILLTEDEVALFPNKFKRAVVADEGTEVEVKKPEGSNAPPAAPTIKDMIANVEALPKCIGDAESVYEDAGEALQDFSDTYGELLTDDYKAQIIAAFDKKPDAPAAPAAAPAAPKKTGK